MSRLQDRVLGSAIFALLLFSVAAKPRCAPSDEICREKLMHPDMEDVSNAARLRAAASGENLNEFWINKGKEFVREKLNAPRKTQIAKNVIFFIGDGMGLTTLAAARNMLGGEEQYLSFEKFPYTGLSKTYSVSHIVPDSAGTGTAYLCGVKTNSGMLGINANVSRGSCETVQDSSKLYSIAKWSIDAGKSAGVVTTTRITHASPAAAYAQVAERDWEHDGVVAEDCGLNSGIKDIAYQLIHGEVGSKLNVMFGGGRSYFEDTGYRTDGKNLITEFQAMNSSNIYVSSRTELMNTDLSKADRVLGLFKSSHLSYHLDKKPNNDEPTLEELTRKAIEHLSQNKQGYFLFVEGGRIDHGHHNNKAHYALDETIELSKAVQAAIDLTSTDDTLIVVSSDHSHAFSFSGYPTRGNDIFSTTSIVAQDGKEYMTLSYANGPGYAYNYNENTHERLDPHSVFNGKVNEYFPATVPLSSETHGGDDVAVFASGPHAHLFTGVYEQNNLPHIMAYASCVGSGLKAC